MKALIVDDERLARNELRRLLRRHPEIEIVGEAANAPQARKALEDLEPDLLFLDVQMPGETGFDLLASLDSVPLVVFTTAYDEHALRAFEVNALDYLVKPIEPRRLASTVSRLLARAAPGVGERLEADDSRGAPLEAAVGARASPTLGAKSGLRKRGRALLARRAGRDPALRGGGATPRGFSSERRSR
jgi:two-component system, LytTR family, response regulator